MNSTAIVGARVQDARKRRGLTQRELARLSSVSVSLVRKLEQGDYENGLRLETLHRLAVALDVTTTALMSEPDAKEADAAALAAWEPLCRAVASDYDGEPGYEPTIGGVRDALNDAVDAVLASQYETLRVTLPALLRDADALVRVSPSSTVARALPARSAAWQLAAYMLGQMWQFDAAMPAIDLAIKDASDGLTAMAAMDWKCWLLLRQGRLAESGRLAAQQADAGEPARLPKATPDELAAWGRLQIRVSAAAVRDNRPDDARESLRAARMAAAGMSRDAISPFNPWAAFGPVTVSMIAAENAVIQDRPDVTLRAASRIVGRDFPVPRNFLRHRLDVASACAATDKLDEAAGVLTKIRAAAPEWLAQQRYARDTLTSVITRKRFLSGDVRDLADFMSLPA